MAADGILTHSFVFLVKRLSDLGLRVYRLRSVTESPLFGKIFLQKLKSHLVRTQSLNVLSLKPGVGQYIAIHATLTARAFFLANFYPSGPFICIF